MTLLELGSGISIIRGDSIAVLPALRPTAIVTDPVWPNAAVPLAGWDDPYGLFEQMVDAMPASVERAAIILGCDSDPGILAPLQRRLPFFRVSFLEFSTPSYKGLLLNGFEAVYLYGAPPRGGGMVPGRYLKASAPTPRRSDLHPCPRRIEHVEWVVSHWTHPDDLVCDPFCGSGTTLLACRLHGRKAIGIEIDESHYKNALRYYGQNPVLLEATP